MGVTPQAPPGSIPARPGVQHLCRLLTQKPASSVGTLGASAGDEPLTMKRGAAPLKKTSLEEKQWKNLPENQLVWERSIHPRRKT